MSPLDAAARRRTASLQPREWWLAFAVLLILSDALDGPLTALFGTRPLLSLFPVARLPLAGSDPQQLSRVVANRGRAWVRAGE